MKNVEDKVKVGWFKIKESTLDVLKVIYETLRTASFYNYGAGPEVNLEKEEFSKISSYTKIMN